jgi:glycosyltransferase involved in cell wall biosynthesis
MIKISIITINRNNKNGLYRTIQSVVNQTYINIEYIIIDGDSQDGSKDLLSNDKIHIAISESDNGIYDAMNKGIKLSSGVYCLFLNSGDVFHNKDVVNNLLKTIDHNITDDIIYGDIKLINEDNSSLLKSPKELNFYTLLNAGLPHQAAFIKRDLFLKYGFYDNNMEICADWVFFLDVICKHNATSNYVPMIIADFSTDGISSHASNTHIIRKEKEGHLKLNYNAFLDYYRSTEPLLSQYAALKNSRLRKMLAIFFRQLRV